MSNFKRLSVGMAAMAACVASAGVANAAAITLTATYTLQSYLTLEKDSFTFDYVAPFPTDLVYSRYIGAFQVDGDTVDPFSGTGSYVLPGFTAKGITIYYQLIPAVPEASTWAMMLIGLGAIGIAARRRHNVSVTYA